ERAQVSVTVCYVTDGGAKASHAAVRPRASGSRVKAGERRWAARWFPASARSARAGTSVRSARGARARNRGPRFRKAGSVATAPRSPRGRPPSHSARWLPQRSASRSADGGIHNRRTARGCSGKAKSVRGRRAAAPGGSCRKIVLRVAPLSSRLDLARASIQPLGPMDCRAEPANDELREVGLLRGSLRAPLGLDLADGLDHRVEGQKRRGMARLVVAHGLEYGDVGPFSFGGRGAVFLEHPAHAFAQRPQLLGV